MNATAWIALYGAIVATVTFGWKVYETWRDQYRLTMRVRYIDPVGAYIVEMVNSGRRSVTVTGAGINRIPSLRRSSSDSAVDRGDAWSAAGEFPRRIDEGDSAYFSIPWDSTRAAQRGGVYLWLRDARGKVYRERIEKPDADAVTERPLGWEELAPTEQARLFNLELQRDAILDDRARLALIDAEIKLFRLSAERRIAEEERRRNKMNDELGLLDRLKPRRTRGDDNRATERDVEVE